MYGGLRRPLDENVAEPGLRKGIAALRCTREPNHRLRRVLGQMLALQIHQREHRLGIGIALCSAALEQSDDALGRRCGRIGALELLRQQAGRG